MDKEQTLYPESWQIPVMKYCGKFYIQKVGDFMPPLKDRTGERNGRLTILYRAPDKIYPSRRMVV